MRREFGKVILELARDDPSIYLLTGDIGFSIFDDYRKEFPDRFKNIGICEQSLISIAAGFAL
jgi:transketolase